MAQRKEYTLSNKEETWQVKRFIPLSECSIENPIVINDYPYGFNKRCTIKYYIEFKKNQGYRNVTQTFYNNKWNAPKKGIYKNFLMAYELENGHIGFDSLHDMARDLEQLKIIYEYFMLLSPTQKTFISQNYKAIMEYQSESYDKMRNDFKANNPNFEFDLIIIELGWI